MMKNLTEKMFFEQIKSVTLKSIHRPHPLGFEVLD